MPSLTYAPSEAAIEDAIKRRIGSPGFFQRVAEQVARALYSDLKLVPHGRRSDEKTVRGWPDAYLTKADDTVIAIEATTAADAIARHWPKDLAKLQEEMEPDRRGGLIWVAWCDPTTSTMPAEMREQARCLGLPTEDIHIVFRKDLCARLREPVNARFWINDLGLAATSGPFDRIHDLVKRHGYRSSPGLFPTSAEYEDGRVHEPRLLAEVEKALSVQRKALVVGHGAAGKTTLAMVLAHRPQFRLAPTYYLDLTATEGDPVLLERAGEAIAALADRGVLFAIDNAHLDPDVAVRILEQWESFGRGSQLLILARRIRAKSEVWSAVPELESLALPAFDLAIEPSDLEGIYRRLYRARTHTEALPVQPDVLNAWHTLFGGDLMTFSAAVLGLLGRGGEPASLDAADARAFVRKRYLQDVKLSSEQSDLLDLAAVSEKEGLLPVDAFADGALEQSIRSGLVWIEKRGLGGAYHYYRMAHPGLGTLLRDAAHRTETSLADRCRLLQAHPYVCTATAMRLRKIGETAEAAALLEALWRQAGWPLADLPLSWWSNVAAAVRDLKVATLEEISSRSKTWLAQRGSREALVERALATPLDHLASFLEYAREPMPEVWKAIRDELLSDARSTAVADHFVREGPSKLAALCKQDQAFITILPAIDAGQWSLRWNSAYLRQPGWFIDFAGYCYRADRSDLVGPVAGAIIRTARDVDFPAPIVTIRHLSFIMSSPHGCTADELDCFFTQCLGPDWLAAQYRSPDASVGALAGAVRSVAMCERADIRRQFLHAELLQRLQDEQPAHEHTPRLLADWLCLLSAARLLGCGGFPIRRSIGSPRLAECLAVYPPGRRDEGILTIQAGLWTGLREWCHLSCEKLTADGPLAEGILAQFRAADPVGRPRLAGLNAVMIDWLERCRDHGWYLIADDDSLLDALELWLRAQGHGDQGDTT